MNTRKEKLDMFQAVYVASRHRLEDKPTEEQRLILHYCVKQGLNGDSRDYAHYRLS